MARLDDETRAELADTGELFKAGYEPRMARVHERNARRLRRIIQSVGWPGTDLVGPDRAKAAWIVLQHAIAEPEPVRRTLPLLEAAVRAGAADPAHAAFLEDRIRFFEGRPQRYGTQLDWDADGNLSPGEAEEPERLDDRRLAAGLPSLSKQTEEARNRAMAEGERAPVDHKAYLSARDEWARRVGWRRRLLSAKLPIRGSCRPTSRGRSVQNVQGFGGFFFRAKDPAGLAKWYQDHLGINPAPTNMEMAPWVTESGVTVFSPFGADTDYFAADKAFMLNFRVADLDAMIAQLKSADIEVSHESEMEGIGRFARIHDPEGNAIELWEPAS